jgi:NAD(P)H dehydrogenase (quinone)
VAKIGIIYYSMYGSTHELATQLAEGVGKDGGDAQLRRVPELLPDEVIENQPGVQDALEAQSEIEEASVEELRDFDGIIFGSPTRYGNRVAQMSNFLDQTGPLWQEGALHGKAAGFFTGAATVHGGHESTILTMSTFAYHHGMVIVPAGYALQPLFSTATGGTPYGPSHLSPTDGSKHGLSDDEIDIARGYAAHFHQVTEKLAA